MKYLKRFNESYNHDTYEITDYFTDLEDEGLITIREIEECVVTPSDYENIEDYKRNIIDLYRRSQRDGSKDVFAESFGKYLDYFSLESLQDFYNFTKSEQYIPFISLSISVIDETKNNWIERIKESIKRCEETSLVTKVFGMLAVPHGIGINRVGYANIFFTQIPK